MKKFILLLLLSSVSTGASASLIGRVNAYYDPDSSEAVKASQASYEGARKHYLDLNHEKEEIKKAQDLSAIELGMKRRNLQNLLDEMQAIESMIEFKKEEKSIAQRQLQIATKKNNEKIIEKEKQSISELNTILEKFAKQRNELLLSLSNAKTELEDAQLKFEIYSKRQPPSEENIRTAKEYSERQKASLQGVIAQHILYADTNGVNNEALSDFKVSTTTGGTKTIDANVYQYSIPTRKSHCIDNTRLTMFEDIFEIYPSHIRKQLDALKLESKPVPPKLTKEECGDTDLRKAYSLVPMYIMFHKTVVDAQTSNTTVSDLSKTSLSNDLLNNETGALFNLKFTPSIWENNREDPYTTHISVLSDFGYKHIEQPAADQNTIDYVGAGYLGLGINFEFSVFTKTSEMIDLSLKNTKPAGNIAFGLGFYRNLIGSINDSIFQTPVPKYFNTIFAGGELQITNTISAVFSRSLPRVSGPNPLGSYTSISIKVKN